MENLDDQQILREPPAKKANRSENFSRNDVVALVEIIKNNDFGPILEKHGNDNITVIQKKNTWDKIYDEWKALPNVSNRTLLQLQTKWKAIVKGAKSEDAGIKRKRKLTGGGPPPNDPDPLHAMVKQLLCSTFAEIPNKFDGDSSTSNQLDSLVGDSGGSEGRLLHFELYSFAWNVFYLIPSDGK